VQEVELLITMKSVTSVHINHVVFKVNFHPIKVLTAPCSNTCKSLLQITYDTTNRKTRLLIGAKLQTPDPHVNYIIFNEYFSYIQPQYIVANERANITLATYFVKVIPKSGLLISMRRSILTER
jgi:hypothetical protein